MWPGTRALTGGLLIAVGFGAVAWQFINARSAPSTSYVVAVGDLAPGAAVTSDDVGLQAMDLPASLGELGFGWGEQTDVLGAVVVNPVAAGELVMRSDVRSGRPGDAGDWAGGDWVELAVELDEARALNGRLRRGELVDVVATIGVGVGQVTRTVAPAALVLWVDGGDGAGLSVGTVTVTLAVRDAGVAEALVQAADTGEMTLVRARRSDAGLDVDGARGSTDVSDEAAAAAEPPIDADQSAAAQTAVAQAESQGDLSEAGELDLLGASGTQGPVAAAGEGAG